MMRRLFILICLLCTAVARAELVLGHSAPNFTATTLDDKHVDLTAWRGQVVIVHFWATWCEPCRLEMPLLDAYYRRHRQDGVQVLAISMDEPADAARVREVMQPFAFSAAFDRDTEHHGYGRIWRMPMTFIIDRQGILRHDGSEGEPKVDAALLEQLVTPLLAPTAEKH